MLPEQYCDYLLALYSEGEEIQQTYKKSVQTKMAMPYFFVAAIILLTLFLNYFTQLPYGMQISSSIISITALIILAFIFSKRIWQYHIPLIGAAFLFLLGTVQAVEHFAPGRTGILYFCLLCQSAIWIFIGKRFSIVYFSVAGYLGTALIVYFIIKLYSHF